MRLNMKKGSALYRKVAGLRHFRRNCLKTQKGKPRVLTTGEKTRFIFYGCGWSVPRVNPDLAV
jgi:hypothetical protein